MHRKHLIQVSEFEKLYFDDKKPFKQKHWEALCEYLDKQNKRESKRIEYFRILNKGIQFTNFVGVIQAGNLTIEILPKVDKRATTAANETLSELQEKDGEIAKDKAKWQKVLLQMLKECKLIKVNQADFANLRLKSNSILDIYIELFLSKAESLMHQGLIKRYKKKEGNRTALKGQLLFQKQLAYNIIHKERFFVRHSEYNYDNVYNQLIYKTLKLIPLINSSSAFSDRVGRLLIDMPEVSYCVANEQSFSRIKFDRKSEPYKEALLISKMLLLNYRPDITGGHESVMAILFDMNRLWEEFVFRRIKKEEAAYNIKVLGQDKLCFWRLEGESFSKTIRPDIVIEYKDDTQPEGNLSKPGGERIIIDTKWKNIDDLSPKDNDLKQMFVYNLFWTCDKSILLYPSNKGCFTIGKFHSYKEEDKMDTSCGILSVSILDSVGCLKTDLAKEILDMILEKRTTTLEEI